VQKKKKKNSILNTVDSRYNTIHFRNFYSDKSLDLERFKDAIDNREEANWDKLYENYNAAVDVPTWLWYKDLIKKYPDAKVILTVRDPEGWYTSVKKASDMLHDPKNHRNQERSMDVLMLLGAFSLRPTSPLYGKLENKESGMAAFIKHNQEVIDFVPKENLLVMELGEGWERLCGFLGKPIPDIPYPNLNNPKELQKAIDERNEGANSNIKALNVGEKE
jgi:hypothetical protein